VLAHPARAATAASTASFIDLPQGKTSDPRWRGVVYGRKPDSCDAAIFQEIRIAALAAAPGAL
jgi:hypothetical protein